MDQKDRHNYFEELISKYLSKNASAAEIKELETWVLEDDANKQHFMASKKAWMLSSMKENAKSVDVDKLWEETSAQLRKEAKVIDIKPKQTRRNWLRVAAAIALLGVASFLILQNSGSDSTMLVSAKDEIQQSNLPDGSNVTLNRFASLSFENIENRRAVKLEGDAFFDVARDETKPFVIQTQNIEIEVLGTSFYVDAREGEEEIQVTVQSGSVAVRAGNSETILKANEKAIFQKNKNQLVKVENEDPNFNSLKTGILLFEKTKLDEIVFALNRHFHIDIELENENLKNCIHTGTYNNKSLETVFQSIIRTAKIESKKVGDKIIWSGVGCDE